MRRPIPLESWPESWKESYQYDQLELYGATSQLGYAYAYAHRRRHTLDLIQRVAEPGAQVLDIAAAQGNYSLTLAELGYNVIWNDLRTELAGYVQLKHERGRVEYLPGNVFDVGARPLVDVVLAAEIIEHVAHPDQFLKAVGRLVKPRGFVVLTTPNGQYIRHHLPKFSDCEDPSHFESFQFRPNADGHIFLLHCEELQNLARPAGLEIIELRLFANSLTSGHLKSEALLQRMPLSWVDRMESFTRALPQAVQRRLNSSMAVLLQRS